MKPKGVSLVEALIVMAIMAIVWGIMALNLRPFSDPLQDATVQVEGLLKQVRAKAMATTSAYRLQWTPGALGASHATSCLATSFTADPSLDLQVNQEVQLTLYWAQSGQRLTAGDWACFTSRGLLLTSRGEELLLRLEDHRGRTQTLKVLLGGGVARF